MQTTKEFTPADAGCYFDGAFGHYNTVRVIDFAHRLGFILGQFESFTIDKYDECYHEDNYPYEALIELCDDAESWLNSAHHGVHEPGQNLGPKLPEGFYFAWNDGDFGLYPLDDEGEVVLD